MSVLPRISGLEVVVALAKLGYEKDRSCGSPSSMLCRQKPGPNGPQKKSEDS